MTLLLQGPNEIPPQVIPIVQSFFMTIAIIALGIPIIRAIARRWERHTPPPQIPADVTARLERIEQAVEAVAIEVERISEGQRFTAKLMADLQQRVLPPSDAAK
ncbi:MAG TPA: hypothetical protein VHB25_05940 [Gemmatimonadaceae bacterium]|nr:hypothetical protein [Gemmatimonadaceae bacterium]